MKTSRFILILLVFLSLSSLNTLVFEVMAACFEDLPSPVLEFTGTEDYEVRSTEFTRYRLNVTNASEYPEALFSAAPELPPCGANTNSSRTWVDIVDDQNRRLYGFCAANLNTLGQLWFAKPKGEAPPLNVSVTFQDRECQRTYTSNTVSTIPVHVRQNIREFGKDANRLDALQKGIEVMQSRPATDPTSWIYQANMHGDPGEDGPSQAAWSSCQHGSWHFLAWHRMYLYYFERILRTASGDPTLALPYWNYSDPDDPNARQIPLPYRQPANPTSNRLFVAHRSPSMNSGGLLPASGVDLERALELMNFSSPPSNSQSFGGQRTGPGHSLSPHSVFEGTPHDTVHVNIGGGMATFDRAARDPVFWLHHANIDRLWETWLLQGDNRSNPISGQGDPWLNQVFTFFDENGAMVTMTGGQILHTVSQLHYRYDDHIPSRTRFSRRFQLPHEETPIVRLAQPKPLMKKDLEDFILKGEPRSITLQLPEEQANLVQGHLMLHLEKVRVHALPMGHYEIYVNLPPGDKPKFKSDYYVGNMSFFGSSKTETQAQSFSFLLDTLEKKLKSTKKWTGEIKVTFIKTGPQAPSSQKSIERSEDQGLVQIGEISIKRE